MPSPAVARQQLSKLGNLTPPNLYVTQVMPPFWDGQISFVQSFLRSMDVLGFGSEADWDSLEAYTGGRLITSVLQRLDPSTLFQRESFLSMLYNSSVYILDGMTVGPYQWGCNQGMRQIWISGVSNGTYDDVNGYRYEFPHSCFGDTSSLRPPLIFGLCASLSGANGETAGLFLQGVEAAFSVINAQGGIDGHMLHVLAEDDHGSAEEASSLSWALIHTERVYGMLGGSTSSTAAAIASQCSASEVPYIGPLSGNSALRLPFDRCA